MFLWRYYRKKSPYSTIVSMIQYGDGRSEVTRTPGILLPNLCLNLQEALLRPLWRFPALLQFLFGTLLPCSLQALLSSFGICVGLNSVY